MPADNPMHGEQFATWQADELPVVVDYSPVTMEEIRAEVEQGFNTIAHGGVEVGGVLYGRHVDGRVRIEGWRDIECEHALGPSFALSINDYNRLDARLREPDLELSGLIPVGWFASHSRSRVALKPADVQLTERHFSEPWQVILILKPSKDGPMKAGFFGRSADGSLRTDSSYREFEIRPDPLLLKRVAGSTRIGFGAEIPEVRPQPRQERLVVRAAEIPAPVARPVPALVPPPKEHVPQPAPIEPEAATASAGPVVPATAVRIVPDEEVRPEIALDALPPPPVEPEEPAEAEPALASPVVEIPVATVPEPEPEPAKQEASPLPPEQPELEFLPGFLAEAEHQARPRSRNVLKAVFATLGVLAAASLAVPLWLQSRPAGFALRVEDGPRGNAEGELHIRWDQTSSAIRQASRAVLHFSDAGHENEIELNGEELRGGTVTYIRRGEDVQLRMSLFQEGKQTQQELARYLGPPVAQKVAEPDEAAEQAADTAELEAEAARLREEVKKESARGRRTRDSIRVLEERLKQDSKTEAPPQP